MLVIRLFRIGKKNQPSFKIVVTDKRNSSVRGRFVEEVGTFNPYTKEKTLKAERIKYWISVGAKPSPNIHNLLVSEKIIEGEKIDVHNEPKAKEEKPVAEEKKEPVAEVKKPEEKPAEAVPEKAPAQEKPAEKAPQAEPAGEKKSEEKEKTEGEPKSTDKEEKKGSN